MRRALGLLMWLIIGGVALAQLQPPPPPSTPSQAAASNYPYKGGLLRSMPDDAMGYECNKDPNIKVFDFPFPNPAGLGTEYASKAVCREYPYDQISDPRLNPNDGSQ